MAINRSLAGRIALGAAVSVGLLALLLAKADLDQLGAQLKQASPWGVIAVLAVHYASLLVRVLRWKLLLAAADCEAPPNAPKWLVLDSVFFGWLTNLVVPARVGELARPAMYARGSGKPFPSVLATSFVERAADLAIIALGAWFALAVLPVPDSIPDELRTGARVAGLAGAAGLLVMVALARPRTGDAPTGRLLTFVATFREGLSPARDPRAAGQILGTTIVIWALEAACVQLALAAFGFELSWSLAICHVVAVTLSIAVVTVPAGLGVEQGVTVAVVAPWGIGLSDALAFSLVLSFAAIACIVPGGLIALVRQGKPKLDPQG